MGVSIAWNNVFENKKRTLAAVSGICFSILLVFMQLGFLQGAKTAAASLFEMFDYDIGIVAERYKFVGAPDSFDKMRLTQALVVPEVEAISNLNAARASWTDLDTEITCRPVLFSIPLDPSFVNNQMIKNGLDSIRGKNTVMVDLYSHKDCGDLSVGREVEVNDKPVTVTGHFKLWVALFADGGVIVSNDNYARLTRGRSQKITFGFIRIKPGADIQAVKKQLIETLPDDVLIFTRSEMIKQEQDYFISVKPVGISFQIGVFVAFISGLVILFQILSIDISNRLNEFATLKAIGFKDWFIYGIGIKQALLYALLSYFPSLLLAFAVFNIANHLSHMPMDLNLHLSLFVLALSLLMCVIPCILALQKVRKTDPAELF